MLSGENKLIYDTLHNFFFNRCPFIHLKINNNNNKIKPNTNHRNKQTEIFYSFLYSKKKEATNKSTP